MKPEDSKVVVQDHADTLLRVSLTRIIHRTWDLGTRAAKIVVKLIENCSGDGLGDWEVRLNPGGEDIERAVRVDRRLAGRSHILIVKRECQIEGRVDFPA